MTKKEKALKLLFVSKWGESLDLAIVSQNEGNKVKFFIDYKPCKEIGDGIIPKVKHWEKHVDWADLIIFDYTGYGKVANELRESGKLVIGSTEYTDQLEVDRNFGQQELKKHKVKIIPYKEFNYFEDAINFIEANPDKYVIKPCGEIQEFKQLLFVGKEENGEDVIRMLRAYEKTWKDEITSFQLQKKVSGVEISVAAYFNGKHFLKPINITFEHKKLFPKELGVSTGEMGTSMFWVDENPVFDATLAKMESTLAKDNFIGHIDINCIVNGNGIYPLEFTCRFGFPQVFIQRAGINEPFGQFLFKIAAGKSFKINTRKGFQVGAYMVVPPFPYTDPKTFESFSKDSIVVIKKPMKEGFHPMHLKKVNGELVITGDSGLAVMISGTGTTMKEAQKQMYNRINNILINHAYYRTDIGDRWAEDFDKLWTWNLL